MSIAQCNYYWSHREEKISSFILVMHYMHYVAYTSSSLMLTVKCDLINVVVKNGPPLGRRKRGAPVMLEKAPGHHKVEKLRELLALESDFNALDKINCMVD